MALNSNGAKLRLHLSRSADFSSVASYVIPTVSKDKNNGQCSIKRGKEPEKLGKTNILPLDNNNSKMRKNSTCTFKKKNPCNNYGQGALCSDSVHLDTKMFLHNKHGIKTALTV